MATIYDVAKSAGVSRSTVSRVLNDQEGVNPQTKKRVLEAINALHYKPNASARSLALQKCNVIGVVAKEITDTFYGSMIDTIYRKADANNYGVLFCINNLNRKAKVDYFHTLYGKVDGILFLGENTVTRHELQQYIEQSYPVVLIENNFNLSGTTTINIDNFQSAYMATSYLISRGHKKIAHIAGDSYSFEGMHRIKGYVQALQDHGVFWEEGLIRQCDYSAHHAYDCALELLDTYPDLTGVFCATDIMAAGFIQGALGKGFSVPQDLSVIGFDNLPQNQLPYHDVLPLTTVDQPREEMAAYAVEALIGQIQNGFVGENKIFPTELIIRKSTS